jgi:hypothetical protein
MSRRTFGTLLRRVSDNNRFQRHLAIMGLIVTLGA